MHFALAKLKMGLPVDNAKYCVVIHIMRLQQTQKQNMVSSIVI